MTVDWTALANLDMTLRPLAADTVPLAGRRSLFSARFGSTVKLLGRELGLLRASHIVLQLDFQESDLRLDGYPRANARMGSPGLILSFDSKHGPLRYATGEYDDWADNLRAIALSMEALRAVDRYGVSKRGEQYRGWRALPERASEPADMLVTREQAREFLATHGGFKAAAAKFHPDHENGDPAMFRAAVKARGLAQGPA